YEPRDRRWAGAQHPRAESGDARAAAAAPAREARCGHRDRADRGAAGAMVSLAVRRAVDATPGIPSRGAVVGARGAPHRSRALDARDTAPRQCTRLLRLRRGDPRSAARRLEPNAGRTGY